MSFSIIIPVYNAEQYLEECVKSVLAQSFKDYELILIDDGSTDKSGEILDRFKKEYPEIIKVLHKENGGQFSARKKGIELAGKEYVISLDADDCLRYDALEIIDRYITQNNSPDIVFHNFSKSSDYSVPLIKFDYADKEVFSGLTKEKLYKRMLGTSTLNSFCGKAYKASLIKNAKWDEEAIKSVRNGEDLLQVLPLFTMADSVVYCDCLLYYYRWVETSASHKYSPTYYLSVKLIGKEFEKYIDIWNMEKADSVKQLHTRLLKDISIVIKHCILADKKTCIEKMKEIGKDGWFKNLYKSGCLKEVSFKDRIVLYLTYGGHTRLLYTLLKLKGRG